MTFHAPVYDLIGRGVLDPVLILFANYLIFAVPAALIAFWFSGREAKVDATFVFTTIVVSLVISYSLGLLYSHPAPYQVQGGTLLSGPPENAFPSQHATSVFGMVWPLYALGRPRLSSVFLVIAMLVSVGRVATGLHYPVDILGSLLASLLGFGLVWVASDSVKVVAGRAVDIEARLWSTVLETFR